MSSRSIAGLLSDSTADILLMRAAKLNDPSLARQAINLGANVNVESRTRHTRPIHLACENGFVDAVKVLAFSKGVDLTCQDVFGLTPLALAIIFRRLQVVTILLEAGANPNQPSALRCSPVHLAVMHSNYNVLKELVKFGAKVNLKDCFGKSPLYVSIFQTRDFKITQFLLNSGADPSFQSKTCLPLLSEVVLAAKDAKMLAVIQLLTSYDVDINRRDILKQETALHKAATIGYEPVISFLVGKGGDLDAVNIYNMRPYDIAILHSNKKAAEALSYLESHQHEVELSELSASRKKKIRIHL